MQGSRDIATLSSIQYVIEGREQGHVGGKNHKIFSINTLTIIVLNPFSNIHPSFILKKRKLIVIVSVKNKTVTAAMIHHLSSGHMFQLIT